MRALAGTLGIVLSLGAALGTGCAELGVVTDASSISYGRPNRGRLIDGVKLPDSGPGYMTPPTWSARGNRYGTNELVALIKGVGKRMKKKSRDARLVVADLSSQTGGEAHAFHRSHQSGRDVDLIYYERDAAGKAIEPDVMHVFDATLTAKDGSGVTIDVPRTWNLVRDLLTANEAYVQYIFMYKPIAEKLIEHARSIKEPDVVIARAEKALKQPGDSAPHNDHMHVRVYCADTDRQFGCQDIGPLELLAEREAEARDTAERIAATQVSPASESTAVAQTPPVSATRTAEAVAAADEDAPVEQTAADVWAQGSLTTASSSVVPLPSFSALVRPTAAPTTASTSTAGK